MPSSLASNFFTFLCGFSIAFSVCAIDHMAREILFRKLELFFSHHDFKAILEKNGLLFHLDHLAHINDAALMTSEKSVVKEFREFIHLAVTPEFIVFRINQRFPEFLLNQ